MKRILFLLLIISSIARAQGDDQTKYTYYRYKYGNQEARGEYDSVLKIPFIDTSLFHPSRPGALLMRPADSLIYKWNGVFWGVLVGSGGSGSGTVNSGTQYRIAYYAGTGTAVSQAAAITANKALISDANGVPTHSAATATELGYLSGVTSPVQTQINSKINPSDTSNKWVTHLFRKTASDSVFYVKGGIAVFAFKDSTGGGSGTDNASYHTITAISDTSFSLNRPNGTKDTVIIQWWDGNLGDVTTTNHRSNFTINSGAVTNAKLASGIDAAKIADGSVSNTKFQYLNTVTSNVQTQIDGKQTAIQYQDEGTGLGTKGTADTVNFVGAGVTSTRSGTKVTVTIPGGGGGGSVNDFRLLTFQVDSSTNAPAAGASYFKLPSSWATTKRIFLSREGEEQVDTTGGIKTYQYLRHLDTVFVYPNLTTGERWIAKAYPDSNWHYDGLTVIYDANAQAYFTAVEATGATISSSDKNALNQLVLDLKSAGAWTSMVDFGTPLGATANAHRIGVKTAANALTYTSGTFSHDATGIIYVGGATGLVTTNITASTLSHSGFGLLFYTPTNSQGGNANSYDIGREDGTNYLMMSTRTGSDLARAFTSVANADVASTNSIGFWIMAAADVTTLKIYKNGTALATNTTSRSGATMPSGFIRLFSMDDGNVFTSNREVSIWGVYNGAIDDTKAAAISTAFTTFKTAIGL